MKMSASSERHSISMWLSKQMRRAGFCSNNATIQSAMASVMEDVLRCLLKTDSLHVFGSFSDGWGSSLKKLDGSVDMNSDIDVTVMSGKLPLHPVTGESDATATGCSHAEHICAEYRDGHIYHSNSASGPNFGIPKSKLGMIDAFDIIIAIDCCRYPPIRLLQPDYKNRIGQSSRMPSQIVQLLRDEVDGDSPKCHAVAATPPQVEPGKCMRVSTTMLERAVMHNLSTVQGQFFILIKHFIKNVISQEVAGLKTYMAKNLLFHMLDEVEHWTEENLLDLLDQALQMLQEMMESSDSADVCMRHFFLQDASVYFKTSKSSKLDIIHAVEKARNNLLDEVEKFVNGLAEFEVSDMQFHALFPLHLMAEMHSYTSAISQKIFGAFSMTRDVHNAIAENFSGVSVDNHLNRLLTMVEQLPDCVRVTRDWLRALAHLKVGRSLDLADCGIEFPISRGVKCSTDDRFGLSFNEARTAILSMLQNADSPMKVTVQDDRIVHCALESELSALTSLIASMREGNVIRSEILYRSLLKSSRYLAMLVMYRQVESTRARAELTNLTRHIRSVVGTSNSAPTASSAVASAESSAKASLELDGIVKSLTEDDLD